MTHQTHAAEAHGEHPPTTIREYILIGIVLTVVTAVELWVSYSGMSFTLMVAVLMVLSAFKFGVVVSMFMHLRFEHGLLFRLFSFGLVLGTAMILALTALFWNDRTDIVGGVPADAAPGAAAPAKH